LARDFGILKNYKPRRLKEMKVDGLLRLRLAFLSGLTFTGVRRRAVSHGRGSLGQLETHAQMRSIVDGVLGRALRAGFDAGRRSAEGTSWDLERGSGINPGNERGGIGNAPRRFQETGRIATPWRQPRSSQ
jgi:hypothetical protein